MEIEIKLRVQDRTQGESVLGGAPLAGLLSEAPGTKHIFNEYYRLPESLMRKKATSLRLRKMDGISLVAFKMKAGSHPFLKERMEWEVLADTVKEGIKIMALQGLPSEIYEILSVFEPQPIAWTEFDRKSAVCLFEGAVIEAALDIGLIKAGKSEIPINELELELKSEGGREKLLKLAAEIAAAYGLEYEVKSKFARAVSLLEKNADG